MYFWVAFTLVSILTVLTEGPNPAQLVFLALHILQKQLSAFWPLATEMSSSLKLLHLSCVPGLPFRFTVCSLSQSSRRLLRVSQILTGWLTTSAFHVGWAHFLIRSPNSGEVFRFPAFPPQAQHISFLHCSCVSAGGILTVKPLWNWSKCYSKF